MERDFMGLSPEESIAMLKVEANNDEVEFTGPNRASGMQWPFSNKISAFPQLTSFKVFQDKSNKIVYDPLTSAGFMSLSTADGWSAGEIKNLDGSSMKQQLLGGIPVCTAQHSVVAPFGPLPGMIEPWNGDKTCRHPAQLTIFYDGNVNVYDDISPEKAQAIMFLAGHGSVPSNRAQLKDQAPSSQFPVNDDPVNQLMSTQRASALPSPLSVSPQTSAQSGSGSSNTGEFLAAKTTGALTTAVKVEPPKIISSAAVLSSAVPQARKASLARFLEKRKERFMNASPYKLNKNSEEGFKLEANGANSSTSTPPITRTVSANQGE